MKRKNNRFKKKSSESFQKRIGAHVGKCGIILKVAPGTRYVIIILYREESQEIAEAKLTGYGIAKVGDRIKVKCWEHGQMTVELIGNSVAHRPDIPKSIEFSSDL